MVFRDGNVESYNELLWGIGRATRNSRHTLLSVALGGGYRTNPKEVVWIMFACLHVRTDPPRVSARLLILQHHDEDDNSTTMLCVDLYFTRYSKAILASTASTIKIQEQKAFPTPLSTPPRISVSLDPRLPSEDVDCDAGAIV